MRKRSGSKASSKDGAEKSSPKGGVRKASPPKESRPPRRPGRHSIPRRFLTIGRRSRGLSIDHCSAIIDAKLVDLPDNELLQELQRLINRIQKFSSCSPEQQLIDILNFNYKIKSFQKNTQDIKALNLDKIIKTLQQNLAQLRLNAIKYLQNLPNESRQKFIVKLHFILKAMFADSEHTIVLPEKSKKFSKLKARLQDAVSRSNKLADNQEVLQKAIALQAELESILLDVLLAEHPDSKTANDELLTFIHMLTMRYEEAMKKVKGTLGPIIVVIEEALLGLQAYFTENVTAKDLQYLFKGHPDLTCDLLGKANNQVFRVTSKKTSAAFILRNTCRPVVVDADAEQIPFELLPANIRAHFPPVYYSRTLASPEMIKRDPQNVNLALNTVDIVPCYPRGSLLDYVRSKAFTSLTDKEKACRLNGYLEQIINITVKFSEHSWWLTDIKGANILLDERDSIKIADQKSKYQGDASQKIKVYGSNYQDAEIIEYASTAYLPPELERQNGYSTIEAHVVYTIGATFYELVTGTLPSKEQPADFDHAIFSSGSGRVLRYYLEGMLALEPSKRNALAQCSKNIKLMQEKTEAQRKQTFRASVGRQFFAGMSSASGAKAKVSQGASLLDIKPSMFGQGRGRGRLQRSNSSLLSHENLQRHSRLARMTTATGKSKNS